ncbi:MAG TPA: alanine dehydrogenase, partial [Acidimicrobiia bacterium]|nr:alanine dehydrogenase [Acidimicrobiia bacterium]
MVVGVPKETKVNEYRVSVTPDGVSELVHRGATVVVETGAGVGAAITDDEYRRAGAQIAGSAVEVWERGEVVCKVKEPQAAEFALMREGQVLFTYLHLAAYPAVGQALLDRRVTGIAYETVQLPSGALPLLAPMSEVAGRMAPQIGAHFLERHNGGRGV